MKKFFIWFTKEISIIPDSFEKIASSDNCEFAVIQNQKKKLYGVQFHPEVTHTENGKQIFKNFLFSICKIRKNWNIKSQKIRMIKKIKDTVNEEKVICALSGGVDSSVAALLINRAIKKTIQPKILFSRLKFNSDFI